MTYRGHVKNGQITLDEPVTLPDGTEVRVEVNEETSTQAKSDGDLKALLLRHAGKGRDLPADLAANHDRYVHGKREE